MEFLSSSRAVMLMDWVIENCAVVVFRRVETVKGDATMVFSGHLGDFKRWLMLYCRVTLLGRQQLKE